MSTQKKDIVVLISGSGTNLQAIIDAIKKGEIERGEIKVVISNRREAYGLKRAESANIPTKYFPLKPYTYLLLLIIICIFFFFLLFIFYWTSNC